ncbi:MAG: hypothetical protein JRG70_17900 [Deltaproteobacteria bacterium]|nr:hypothetical protein [Deltaproteobacteria bacterium]MBW2381390.1 hypothetical protein [Deltaproteobacteria bacterium]
MGECDQVRLPIVGAVLVKVRFELRVRGGAHVDEILHQELELLCQASPHDRVVLVEPHRQGFPVERRFADVFLGEALQLFRCRRAVPSLLEARPHPPELPGAYHDGLIALRRITRVEPRVPRVDGEAEDQEMKKRLFD